ncbi:MAG: acetyl-CoA carboxylase biotin carboxylase subunit [Flavobacteriales bacterium]|nr:acetyl-CoA carboxylase biotin carboxylase subunit [Flavobacteriales bacterium]
MKKILVANRGEIALRIMRSARDKGIATVAIYSDADEQAPFVKFADEAVHIGPAPSSESYLRGDRIIEISKELNVDGIHPGYGFLSENAEFAKAVTQAGITFIGPSPEAMDLMGSKLAAKAAVKSYNIPLVPGTDEAIEDVDEALEIAKEIGFPILIKASAGGGGKGMRVVENAEEFKSQMERAVSEAVNSFGDGRVFIEKFVGSPRHIEIQILADQHGNILYLQERECSIQRRHQKVIEEAPSAVLTPELRKAMGESACDVARACNYIGAGTVEFLLDEQLNYYFLEMNTRLQVEHPVTEMITGIDLVAAQIDVARGEVLPYKQEDIGIDGHSIEVRVYAEDPLNNFLPDIGTLKTYQRPEGKGIRVDDGFEEGMEIPIYYDPMISKLIVHAENRQAAIDLMTRAIDHYIIHGIETTLPFCRFAINHEAFVSGHFDTNFVKHYFKPEMLAVPQEGEELIVAALGAFALKQEEAASQVKATSEAQSAWVLRRR